LWVPDSGGDLFADVDNLLTATQRITVATGILNIWLRPVDEAARRFHELTAAHGERLLMGIGVSHAHAIERLRGPGVYTRPVQQVAAYLDGLDAAVPPVTSGDRVLAALGPRMVELARRRSAGAHPYLVTPEHTAITRERLGERPVVAVEQGVVLEPDRDAARELARQHLSFYLTAPNYTNNWKRIGFTDDDLAGGGSDRLVDALYARGDEAAIARRVKDQRDAGATHVCVQVVTADRDAFPRAEWRALAPSLV